MKTHDFPDPELGKAVPSGVYDVGLTGSTTTDTGLEVHAWLDESQYEKSKKVSDQQLDEVIIKRDPFYGEWNYRILHPA